MQLPPECGASEACTQLSLEEASTERPRQRRHDAQCAETVCEWPQGDRQMQSAPAEPGWNPQPWPSLYPCHLRSWFSTVLWDMHSGPPVGAWLIPIPGFHVLWYPKKVGSLSGPRPGSLGAWKCAFGQLRTAPASGSAPTSDPSRRSQRPVHAAHPLLALWPPLKCWVFRDQTASLRCSSSSGAGLLCCGGVSHKCLNREVCSGTSGPPQHGPLHGCAPVHVSRTGLQGPGREGSHPAVPWTGRGAHPCTSRPFLPWPAQACQGQEALKGLSGLGVPVSSSGADWVGQRQA